FTDIDGSIQTVGVDCGSEGLKQIPFVQLVLQGEVVIYIPNWRLEAQKVLREKGLTLRRLKALINIVSENDEMKSDAELIHETYKSKLMNLDDAEAKIKTHLLTRLDELDNQAKTVKIILFDARVQFKSEEISELTFESIQKHCNNLLERLSHEKNEVKNVQRRLDDLSVECIEVIKTPKDMIQESAVSYLDASGHTITESNHYEPTTPVTVDSEPENTLPEPPVGNTESSTQESTKDDDDSKHQSEYNPDWLSRMQA
ncbi:MAG: CdvA-like protein, partial [Candidatus Nitrosopelagicus sp.]|nr:CdvA-like protein [Candidatus Nitrosopelagicus sp.]